MIREERKTQAHTAAAVVMMEGGGGKKLLRQSRERERGAQTKTCRVAVADADAAAAARTRIEGKSESRYVIRTCKREGEDREGKRIYVSVVITGCSVCGF